MKILRLLLIAGLLASTVQAAPLTWSALVGQPGLWPTECTLTRTIRFRQGGGVAAGTHVKVLQLEGDRAILGTPDGRYRFAVRPDDTDILQLAAGAGAQLSPQDRGLSYAAILQREDLWPYRVTLTEPDDLGAGNIVRRGVKVIVMGVDQDQLLVGSERLNTSFDVDPRTTDLMEQARRFASRPGGAPGRFVEELAGKLVDITNSAPDALKNPSKLRYLVFYRGAGWCGPCRQFSPSLLKLYREMKPGHPEFAVVYISADHSAAEMHAYAKQEGFTWCAVPEERDPQLHLIISMFGNTIPQLVVTDRYGKELIDSNRMPREVALQRLADLLRSDGNRE